MVAGRGPVIAVEEAAGWAVRYASYDEKTDTGVELPPAERLAMSVRTLFDLASLTKLFTAVAAVQQLERGTLGIDARVGAYLPEFRAASAYDITVRQLLTHTSGLRPELPLYDCPDDRARLAMLRAEGPSSERGVPLLGSEPAPPPARAGTHHRPCPRRPCQGRDHQTAGNDGHPLRAVPGRGRDRGPAAAVGQGGPRDAAGVVHDENAWALGGVAGHAGLFSTARDLAVFCRALLAGGSYGPARILGPDFVELMLTPPGLGFAIGQSWFMGALAAGGAAGHTGFTGTSLVLDPATGTFLVLLANTVHPRRRPVRNGPRVEAATRMARAVRGA